MGATFDDLRVVVSATVSCDDGQKRCISCTALVAAMGPWTGRAKDWARTPKSPVEGLKAHSIVMKSEGVSPVAVFCNFRERTAKKEVEFYPRPNGTTYWCGEAAVARPCDRRAWARDSRSNAVRSSSSEGLS